MDSAERRLGSIARVHVQNFMTYDNLELKPGPKLNVILGPNGTGKSTILTALCLGLAGKPTLLRKDAKVQQYVKAGCDQAKIEIELYNPNGENNIVTSIFNKDNKVSWKVNGRNKTRAEVEEVISSLHVQVDNLCQFLPQDRVHDFAKLNPQKLLENTEKIVGERDMFEKHEQLKKNSQFLQNGDSYFEKAAKEFQDMEKRFKQLQDEVDHYRQVEEVKVEISALEKWIVDENCKVAVEEYNRVSAEHETNKLDLKQKKAKLKPLEQNIAAARNALTKEKDNYNAKNIKVSNSGKSARELLNVHRKFDEKVQDLKSAFAGKQRAEQQRLAAVHACEKQLDVLKSNLATLDNDDNELKNEIIEVTKAITKESEILSKLQDATAASNRERGLKFREMKAMESELQQVNNVSNQKFQLLSRNFHHVARGVEWLAKNRHIFQGVVHDPMMLAINVVDSRFAKYVEDQIPVRDLIAFTCECRADVQLLVQNLENLNIHANVVHSSGEALDYEPNYPIETLREYGFFTYLRDLVSAPQAILNYLCKMFHFHDIPVGDKTSFDNSERIQRETQLRRFLTENHRFAISISTYSRLSSTQVLPLRQARLLAISQDMGAHDDLQRRVMGLQQDIQRVQKHITSSEAQENSQEKVVEQLRQQKKKLQEKRESKNTLLARINTHNEKLRRFENQSVDLGKEEEQLKKNIQEQMTVLQESFSEAHDRIKVMIRDSSCALICKQNLTKMKRFIEKKEEEIQTASHEFQHLEQKCEELQQRVTERKRAVERLELESRRTKGDVSKLAPVPTSVVDGTCRLEQVKARLELMQQSDPSGTKMMTVMNEYTRIRKKMEDNRKTVKDKQETLAKLRQETEILKQQWLVPLEELIARICENFSQSFSSIGYAGEICLDKGQDESNFEEYGIKIRVKFRENEQLQDLTAWQQSGGERAVTTALYMLSLQELTNVPFCCVDEINQGMDAINERHVFDVLCQMASKQSASQYFLLTPKLLRQLSYSPLTKVFCVCNGPKVQPTVKFTPAKMIQDMKNRT